MSTLQRAVGNSSIMLASQVITWSATLGLTAALGRSLGDAGFGELYLALSFGMIFSVLVEFGLDQQLVRAVAREHSVAGEYLVNSLAIKVVLAGIAYTIIIVLIQVLGYPPQVKLTIAVYGVTVLFNGISSSLTAVYQGLERVLHSAMGTVIEKVLVAVISLILLSQGFGIAAIAGAFVAGSAIGATWKGLFLARMAPVRAPVELRTVRRLIAGALPFFLYWVLGAIYYRIDVVLLSKLTDTTAVGWYGAAYRLFDTLVFLPGIVSTVVMFPILARLAATSHPDLRLALSKGLEVMVMLGVPICTGLFVLAEPIIRFIYGRPEFLPAVPALRLLTIGLFFLYVNSVLGVALVSLNQERKMTTVAALATVFNLGLNWLLIPHFQHIAAAAVTAATEFLIFSYLCFCMPRGLLARTTLIVLAKASLAAIVMTMVLEALASQSVVLLVPIGGLVYCACGCILRLVPADDVRRFRQAMLARRRSQAVSAAV